MNFPNNFRLGILGGGQLGKMICLAVGKWHLNISILDPDKNCSAKNFCTSFECGSFRDFDTVLAFGRKQDILTIEIEHVNVEALKVLEKEGKIIHPRPAALEIIRDKGLQKMFYLANNFPTSTFQIYENKKDIKIDLDAQKIDFPFVWKSRQGGYDGKGVAVVRTADILALLPDVPCVVEELVEIEQEIAVIAARTWAATEGGGATCLTYDCVAMEFDPKANLLDLQVCPANISEDITQKTKLIAQSLIEKLDVCGLLAVELFVTKSGEILVNEVAPRAHNSGHHTIEAAATSQFEQHIRGVLGLPLGDVRTLLPSVMFNLLGADGFAGRAQYVGFEKALTTEGVGIHLYGKAETRPYRKMGHITVLSNDIKIAYQTAIDLKENLKIIAK